MEQMIDMVLTMLKDHKDRTEKDLDELKGRLEQFQNDHETRISKLEKSMQQLKFVGSAIIATAFFIKELILFVISEVWGR